MVEEELEEEFEGMEEDWKGDSGDNFLFVVPVLLPVVSLPQQVLCNKCDVVLYEGME